MVWYAIFAGAGSLSGRRCRFVPGRLVHALTRATGRSLGRSTSNTIQVDTAIVQLAMLKLGQLILGVAMAALFHGENSRRTP